jgi:hypothetical protein
MRCPLEMILELNGSIASLLDPYQHYGHTLLGGSIYIHQSITTNHITIGKKDMQKSTLTDAML